MLVVAQKMSAAGSAETEITSQQTRLTDRSSQTSYHLFFSRRSCTCVGWK